MLPHLQSSSPKVFLPRRLLYFLRAHFDPSTITHLFLWKFYFEESNTFPFQHASAPKFSFDFPLLLGRYYPGPSPSRDGFFQWFPPSVNPVQSWTWPLPTHQIVFFCLTLTQLSASSSRDFLSLLSGLKRNPPPPPCEESNPAILNSLYRHFRVIASSGIWGIAPPKCFTYSFFLSANFG